MEYRRINKNFWHNPVVKDLDSHEKLLYAFLRGCRYNNIIGAFVAWKHVIITDLYPYGNKSALIETIGEDLEVLQQAGLILYDEENELFVMLDHFKDEPIENAKQLKIAKKVLEQLPDSPILSGVKEYLREKEAPQTPQRGNKGENKSDSHNLSQSMCDSHAPEDEHLALEMFEAIKAITPDLPVKVDIGAWANTIRLMREQDKLSIPFIREVFTWANKDSQWRPIIISPDTLRKQITAIFAKKKEQETRP
jgi:hypothetical protein